VLFRSTCCSYRNLASSNSFCRFSELLSCILYESKSLWGFVLLSLSISCPFRFFNWFSYFDFSCDNSLSVMVGLRDLRYEDSDWGSFNNFFMSSICFLNSVIMASLGSMFTLGLFLICFALLAYLRVEIDSS